ncbi:hypothetical protein JNW88_24085 [Micromonospora sp. ATA32]|nr:hypothetical protein [Micromonospora sp. ATA32]
MLTGPIPGRVAPAVTRALSYLTAAALPVVMGAVFLRVPLLPAVAVEVVVGQVDRTTPTTR